MKALKPLQFALAAAVLTLTICQSAQAQSWDHAPTSSSLMVHWVHSPQHRPGPPVHRGPPQHHIRSPYHRRSPSAKFSSQARLADRYARTAVRQSRTAWRFGCASSHPRWSTSYHDHYQWAYRQSAHRAQREIDQRERTLARCLAR